MNNKKYDELKEIFDDSLLGCTLDELIEILTDIKKKYKNQYDNISLNVRTN